MIFRAINELKTSIEYRLMKELHKNPNILLIQFIKMN